MGDRCFVFHYKPSKKIETMQNIIWTERDVITKTCLYNFDPLKPHFHIVKLGFTGVCIIFLISAQNIDCGYSLEPPRLEPPRRGGSNEYPQSIFWAEICKISDFFYLKIFIFWVETFSVYLNRHVFVIGGKNTMQPRKVHFLSNI